jgi:DNA-binding LacI/PurR family transcriptional regulator
MVPDLENPFFASVTKGVQSRARDAGYAVIISDSDEDPSQEADLVRDLSKRVDAVVMCSPRAPDSVIAELAGEGTLVLINRRSGDVPWVQIDNLEGIRLAMVHLHALGHRTVAYVGGPSMSWSNTQRLDALRRVVAASADTELIDLGSFQPNVSGGVAAADLVVASDATAVLAYNDLVAYGLLDRFRQRGVRVPEDLSVVGVDDLPMSALTTPSLTSVGIPLVSCGRASVDMVLSLVQHPDSAPVHHHDLSFQLAVRGSSGVVNPAPTSAVSRAPSSAAGVKNF